jgi:LmbE family N-acetylglucosaminyl deacetylase
MSTFDAAVAGTSEESWAACAWLGSAPIVDLAGTRRLVALAAHADDESLGAGGLLALASDRNLEIELFTASDGSASHPMSRTHTPQDLARLRRAEVKSAMRVLAPRASLTFLELPDGELSSYVDRIEDALRAACEPNTVLLSPWAHDRHPDHAACSTAARHMARQCQVRLLEYPIWAWHWAQPSDDLIAIDPDVSGVCQVRLDPDLLDRKRAAISRYASQVRPLSPEAGDEPVVSQEALRYFDRPSEHFFEVGHRTSSAGDGRSRR